MLRTAPATSASTTSLRGSLIRVSPIVVFGSRVRRVHLALLLLPLLDRRLFRGLIVRIMERVATSFVRMAQIPLQEDLVRRCAQKPGVCGGQVVSLPIPKPQLAIFIR